MAFDEGYPKAMGRESEGRYRPIDPPAHHQDIEPAAVEGIQRPLAALRRVRTSPRRTHHGPRCSRWEAIRARRIEQYLTQGLRRILVLPNTFPKTIRPALSRWTPAPRVLNWLSPTTQWPRGFPVDHETASMVHRPSRVPQV